MTVKALWCVGFLLVICLPRPAYSLVDASCTSQPCDTNERCDGSNCQCVAGYKENGDNECVDPCKFDDADCFERESNTCSKYGPDCQCDDPDFTYDSVAGECFDDCEGKKCRYAHNPALCEIISRVCTCKTGYEFDTDDDHNCIEIDDCKTRACPDDKDNPCEDIAGVCTCMYNKVFDSTGQNCQLPCADKGCYDVDEPDTCENVGTTCVCLNDLKFNSTGDCVDDCAGKPCSLKEPATCIDNDGQCECGNGYSFTDEFECEDDCYGKPCYVPGSDTCHVPADSYQCVCKGVKRFNHEWECVDDCYGKPCETSKTCEVHDDDDDGRCSCISDEERFDNNFNCVHVCTGLDCFDIDPIISLCSENEGVCICEAGLRFDDTGDCIDDCVDRECYTNGTCLPNSDHFLCECGENLKFDKDGEWCIDVCNGRDCYEDGTCSTNEGICECDPGLRFNEDHECVDDCEDRECEENGNCEVNDNFLCECDDDLKFDEDGEWCIDVCEGRPCYDNHTCSANEGVCECNPGLRFNEDLYCIDECHGRLCDLEGDCHIDEETFICKCDEGQTFNEFFQCKDDCYDKPCLNSDLCSVVNRKCRCDEGYQMTEEGMCNDVNECAAGTAECRNFSSCFNTEGWYTCRCWDGYVLTGNTCIRESNVIMIVIAAVSSILGVILIGVAVCVCVSCCRVPRKVPYTDTAPDPLYPTSTPYSGYSGFSQPTNPMMSPQYSQLPMRPMRFFAQVPSKSG